MRESCDENIYKSFGIIFGKAFYDPFQKILIGNIKLQFPINDAYSSHLLNIFTITGTYRNDNSYSFF